MTYAYMTDGLDYEKREEFDRMLASTDGTEKAKAKRERDTLTFLRTVKQ